MSSQYKVLFLIIITCLLSACTAKVVGDPDRPITINAHITLDIKQLENTAGSIEDYVSGKKEVVE